MNKKTKRIVYGLGFTDEDLYKPANAFSGGQKRVLIWQRP